MKTLNNCTKVEISSRKYKKRTFKKEKMSSLHDNKSQLITAKLMIAAGF